MTPWRGDSGEAGTVMANGAMTARGGVTDRVPVRGSPAARPMLSAGDVNAARSS